VSERIAIVTGAARGIGAGIAIRLAADGMAVAVLDLNEADCAGTVKEIENAGGKALAIGTDVSKTDQANAAVERVAAELGEPTVLVNNAGITRDAMLFKMTDEQWDSVISVNLRGPFLMCRAAQKYMSAQKWGRIVNISSSSAFGNRGQTNYSATKAGIEGFTKTLAMELGKFGITANAVGPHFIATDMTRAMATSLKITFDELVDTYKKQIPVNRVGQPADVAAAVSFLVGEDAGFVSGQILYVAGGPYHF
jgi:3-oxoacyl-[acyl-carrier protein] reductase